MRVLERRRSSRLALEARPFRPASPAPAVTEESPFNAVIGVLIGVLLSLPLWALIWVGIRRLLGA
jgi:hypothetical protein